MREERVRLEVSILPDARTIAITQRVVEDLSRRILRDEDVGWRIGMAAHELLDNARKYGQGEIARFCLAIDPAGSGHSASVNVRNRGSTVNIAELESTFANLAQAADARSFYVAAMRRTIGRQGDFSGLGLARIWAEGEMSLSVAVDDGCVEINAQLCVGGK